MRWAANPNIKATPLSPCMDHFEDGKPKSAEPFVTGFLTRLGNGEYGFVGRPFGLAVGKDGSLFIGDDANGAIYRVTYDNAKTTEIRRTRRSPSRTRPSSSRPRFSAQRTKSR
jgi:hypothetical protein